MHPVDEFGHPAVALTVLYFAGRLLVHVGRAVWWAWQDQQAERRQVERHRRAMRALARKR